MEPNHPLNFSIGVDGLLPELAHLFERELHQLAADQGDGSIRDHIKRQANFRNELLYASDAGVPSIDFEVGFLCERARRVSLLLLVAIIIMQTHEKQLFVTQCVQALLKSLRGDSVENGAV